MATPRKKAPSPSSSAKGGGGKKDAGKASPAKSASISTFSETMKVIAPGIAEIVNEKELEEKLKEGRPLRIKLGVDPTAPDIHLGHTVVLQKLRQFQDLGHDAILIIGDFTAMIGDPSGRSATRPQLTHDQVLENAKTYQEQAFKVLDPDRVRIIFNGDWFEIMHLEEILKLTSMVTMQQMLQREDFKERLNKEQPIRAHEILYPIMQGWDSVRIKADVELGGTDQLFNIMVGRNLQKEQKMPQQVGITLNILEGTDGVKKMSKSLGNYIGVTEPPKEMFGKVMSISDELMVRYYALLLGEVLDKKAHPMEAKKELARRLVERYHSTQDAKDSVEDWNTRFSKGALEEADLPEFSLPDASPGDIVSIVVAAYEGLGQTRSKSEVRRLLQQGSVQLNGEKLQDPAATPDLKAGDVLRLDKKRAVRVG